MTAFRPGHYARAALSRGAGYEATPAGEQFRADAVAGYYLDYSTKTRARTAAQPESLLPAALAQLALGWWERVLRDEPGARAEFTRVCGQLEATSTRVGSTAVWLYRVPVAKYDLPPEWCSALAQGQAASVFVRANASSGDERYGSLAHAAVEPLLGDALVPGLVARVSEGSVLEECPTQPPSAILNGWIFAAWGLRDVAVGLGSQRARDAYEDTIGCLRRLLPRYDEGWWSRYSLYPHRMPDLAKTFYHRLHIAQLRVLEHVTGDGEFGDVALRWQSYDTTVNRLRLVAQKARFVASGYR